MRGRLTTGLRMLIECRSCRREGHAGQLQHTIVGQSILKGTAFEK